MTGRSIEELNQRWESLASSDMPEVMKWLRDMLRACEAERVEVPNRDHVASRIGMAYHILPDPDLSTSIPVDAEERTRWILALCVNTLIAPGINMYGITAFAADAWLNEHGHGDKQ
ncbi:MAG TPA: hypothetical protein VLA88_06175 [Candidatus Saccharimonadales bacterium]|nr:hypothetical protein [Candidatus Saccharimonadales bacterium]